MTRRPKEKELINIIGKIWKVKQIADIPYARKSFVRCKNKYLVKIKNNNGQNYWLAIAKDQVGDDFSYRFIKFQSQSRFGELDFKSIFEYDQGSGQGSGSLTETKTIKILNEFNESNRFVKLI